MRNRYWKHSTKYKGRNYVGQYEWYKGERQLALVCILPSGKVHRIVFESHEAAKKAGFKKQ